MVSEAKTDDIFLEKDYNFFRKVENRFFVELSYHWINIAVLFETDQPLITHFKQYFAVTHQILKFLVNSRN